MIDVLLTHSFHLAFDAKQSKKMQPYPPLGTLYAAAALRAAGLQVAVFDGTFVEPLAGFKAALQLHQPKIVAVYEDDFNFISKMCLSHMRSLAQQLSLSAQAHGATVIMHGSDATDHPDEFFRYGTDFVLSGEAEQTLATLCARILQGVTIGDIDGLMSRDAHSDRRGQSRTSSRNPAWILLPAPARELIDLGPYKHAWISAHGYFSTSVVSSRGCPYRCNWCAKPISGDKFNLRDPHDVAEELHQLKKRYGVQHIWFGDDVFALNRRWVSTFADAIESYGEQPLPFKIQTRADLLSDTTVANLKRAGCDEVWLGVESGSQRILDAMQKGIWLSDVHSASERLAQAGIRACFFLQFGYPGEGWNEICETIELVRKTRPDDVGVSVSYPLPGTKFYDEVQARLGSKRNWQDTDDLCTIFTASYADSFYHALRDAIHAEVKAWHEPDPDAEIAIKAMWARILQLEPISRNRKALVAPFSSSSPTFFPLQTLVAAARRA